ncbi:hypothetical protein NUTIK01_34210 [Novosphingobium sp. IK01]|jgi:hypothetical protein|uniref:Uncharacterized protein n=1 Tax=Novosphingobium pituita TaxID=3056842 RepID=A0ABQ6PBK2_9SPHN|nr:hypothetical protein NUTIK01_34210 [Novosphingobium sp. IK01]
MNQSASSVSAPDYAQVSITMEADFCIEALEKALAERIDWRNPQYSWRPQSAG